MVLVVFTDLPPGMLVWSVGRGFFGVDGFMGVWAGWGALRGAGRALYAGIYEGMRAACIDLVYLHMSIYSLILGAGLVGGRGVSGVCRLERGGGREMLVWWGEWFLWWWVQVCVGLGVVVLVGCEVSLCVEVLW